jgi:hypothetical protein
LETPAFRLRTDAHQLRPVAGDTALAEGIKVVARAHQSLIWDRTRHVLRVCSALREFFPAALEAFPDMAATDELVAAVPARAGLSNVETVVGDAAATGLAPGSLDVAMLRHVLSHNGGREQPSWTTSLAWFALVAARISSMSTWRSVCTLWIRI